MDTMIGEEFKRSTVKSKAPQILGILQGCGTVAEARPTFDLPPSEIEEWVDGGCKGVETALQSKPLDVEAHDEKQIRALWEAVGESMLQMPVLKNIKARWGTTTNDRSGPANGCE